MRYLETLTTLFKQIAPDYPANGIIAHWDHKFAHLTEPERTVRAAECLKFLYLRSKTGQGFIPLSGAVDEFWHAFILQTREYAAFCQALPGGDFIHHNSITLSEHAEQVSREATVQRLLDWIPHYLEHFGPFTEHSAPHWMIVTLLQQAFGYTLEIDRKS